MLLTTSARLYRPHGLMGSPRPRNLYLHTWDECVLFLLTNIGRQASCLRHLDVSTSPKQTLQYILSIFSSFSRCWEATHINPVVWFKTTHIVFHHHAFSNNQDIVKNNKSKAETASRQKRVLMPGTPDGVSTPLCWAQFSASFSNWTLICNLIRLMT